MPEINATVPPPARFPVHGLLGLVLVAGGWGANWALHGLRTHWAFFPLWLGFCLSTDGLVRFRTGTSLLTRNPRQYFGLFLLSAPVWWLFEALNLRTQNWSYLGAEHFGSVAYAFWTTLSFTTVMPAVFGAAELVSSAPFLKRIHHGPRIVPNRPTTVAFFAAGWVSLVLPIAWPKVFFPFVWIAPYFIIEPVNIWLGNRSAADWTRDGNWRPVLALWIGVLLTAFFWEMWNYLSYPKWIYEVPWGDGLRLFEMPLLGYGGYLPFALELFAVYHLAQGLVGRGRTDFIRLESV